MAITSAICSSFKQELLQGKHSFESSGGHTFKIALFDSDASLGAATTDYSTSEEITNTSGSAYTAGGATLTNSGVSLSSTTAFTDFSESEEYIRKTDTPAPIIQPANANESKTRLSSTDVATPQSC